MFSCFTSPETPMPRVDWDVSGASSVLTTEQVHPRLSESQISSFPTVGVTWASWGKRRSDTSSPREPPAPALTTKGVPFLPRREALAFPLLFFSLASLLSSTSNPLSLPKCIVPLPPTPFRLSVFSSASREAAFWFSPACFCTVPC